MPFKGTFGKIFLKGHPTFYGSKPTMEVTARSDEYSPKFPKFPNIPKCKLRISPIEPRPRRFGSFIPKEHAEVAYLAS